MASEVLENVNLICVRCSIFVIFFTFISARTAEFAQEPVDVSVARYYPLLGLPFTRLSLIQCAAACLSSPFCAMFMYNLALTRCALLGVSNQTASTVYDYTNLTQWQTYVYKSDCQYMYVRALNGCWKMTSDLVTMSSARSACQNLGGDLLQVRSMEEFTFLQRSFLSTDPWSHQTYWIGASKTSLSSNFTWLDTSLILDTKMWGKYQPDGYGSNAENCVNVIPTFGFALNDIKCDQLNSVVCSIPVKQQGFGK